MCGRYTIRTDARKIAQAFRLAGIPDLGANENVSPTQQVPVVRQDAAGRRGLSFMKWGLVPSWANDASGAAGMINGRAETAAHKPAFRQAFQSRRCLIVADGFYEWQKPAQPGRRKQAYLVTVAGDEPFAFAGLWERWQGGAEPLESCTIITTAANELVAPIHDRMPSILLPQHYDIWLDPKVQDRAELESLLGPYPANEMRAAPVASPGRSRAQRTLFEID